MEENAPTEKQVVTAHRLLHGCLAKIERTDEHISQLNDAITDFLKPKPHRVLSKPDGEHGVIISIAGPKPPLRIGVIAGEAIQQLRSILDHIVCAFVLQAGRPIKRSHAFPICDDKKWFEKARDDGKMEHVHAKAVALIEAMQPYHWPRPQNHWLMALSNLDVTSKHRVIVVLAATSQGLQRLRAMDSKGGAIEMSVAWPKRTLIGQSEDGTEMLSLSFDNDTPVNVEGEPAVQVAFEKVGTVEGEPVVPTLVQMRDNVFRAIAVFDALLKKTKG